MNVRLHDELDTFVALTRPLPEADPIRHSIALTVLAPVYTLPRHRGRGYGSAVTVAAARWSLQAGARHVVLTTDLANPISNAIYPRIGFRPTHDAVEIAFKPALGPQNAG